MASTPEQENAPLASEDEMVLGGMIPISDLVLIEILGQMSYTTLENMAYAPANYWDGSTTVFYQCLSDSTMEMITQVGLTIIFTEASIIVKDPFGKVISIVGATYSIYKIIQAYKNGTL